jgi:hypothetical protein
MSTKLCVQYVVFVYVAQLLLCSFSMKEATVIMGSSARFNKFSEFILASQQKIIKELEIEDGKEVFLQDVWKKGESVIKYIRIIADINHYLASAEQLLLGWHCRVLL